jgi:hypothetical protein
MYDKGHYHTWSSVIKDRRGRLRGRLQAMGYGNKQGQPYSASDGIKSMVEGPIFGECPIAPSDALNARGISTARGGQWYANSVSNVLARA